MVREFQRVVGDEAREQCRAMLGGDDPDLVVACVGGGSNAMGTFAGFLDTDADLVGVEAGGLGLESGQHGASVSRGVPGVLHGARSLFLQDEDGQILEAHSISAGPRLPGRRARARAARGRGPGRYESATDDEAHRRLPAALGHRGHRARARAGARDRLAGTRGRPFGAERAPRCW